MTPPHFRPVSANARPRFDSGSGAMLAKYSLGFNLYLTDILLMGAGVALGAIAVLAL